MKQHTKITLAAFALSLLASCGGGSGSESKTVTVKAPVQSTTVTVSTSLSQGGQISASEAIVNLGDSATFTLNPNQGYQIEAASGCGGSLSTNQYVTAPLAADCTITINFGLVNVAPTISAIPAQTVDEFAEVSLQANAVDIDGSIQSYLWTQTSGISVTVDDLTSANVMFSVPAIIQNESVEFNVTVTDDKGAQANAIALIDIVHTNLPPVINLQNEMTVSENSSLIISANAVDSEGEIAQYLWTQIDGEPLAFLNATSASLTVQTPNVNQQQQAVFEVLVTDADGATANSSVTLTIENDGAVSSNVVLAGVTALSPTAINVEWLESIESTLQGTITYTVHISQQSDFVPSIANSQIQLVGQLSSNIDNLAPSTVYYVLVSAQDSNNNIRYSGVLSVTTTARQAVVNARQIVRNVDNISVSNNTLSYTLSDMSLAPQVNDIIVSTSQNGILRKVVSVSLNGDAVEVQTVPAALNEIYDDVDINTTIKLVNTGEQSPQDTSKTGDAKFQNTFSTVTQNQTREDRYLSLSGPTKVAFVPSEPNSFTVSANVINSALADHELFDFALQSLTHNRLSSSTANFGAVTNIVSQGENAMDEVLQLSWEPSQAQVDTVSQQPYIATFSAKVRQTNCVVSCTVSTASLNVKIYLGSSELQPASPINFEQSGSVSISGSGEYIFEPTLNIAAKIQDASLKSAQASIGGFLDAQLTLDINAAESGELSGKTQFLTQPFSKTLVVGGIPVVIHGDFILSGEYSVQAQGRAALQQSIDIGYFFDAGFEFEDGVWNLNYSGSPTFSFALNSNATLDAIEDENAQSSAQAQLTLIPEIELHFYEFSAGHIKFKPSIESRVSANGAFDGNSLTSVRGTDTQQLSDLNVDIASSVALHTNFTVFDQSVAPWPNEDASSMYSETALLSTSVYALPALTLQVDETLLLVNSCTIAALATATELNETIDTASQLDSNLALASLVSQHNTWEQSGAYWTLSGANSEREIMDTSGLTNQDEFSRAQVLASSLSQYTLRYTGFSKVGAWATQYQEITFDLSDENNDGVPDYWTEQYALNSVSNDSDSDGVSNADEFTHCTFPHLADSDNDGMPDGWEIANGLNPIFNDANDDSDLDARNNLQEYLDNSNPTLADINQAPVVSAGQNQTVDELEAVSLQGSAVDGGTITTLEWSQVAGPLIGLELAESLNSSFIAPEVDQSTELTFALTATDNSGAIGSSQVTIVVNPVNANPHADAGTDVLVNSGELVSLDGSASFDIDGTIISYVWQTLNAQTLFIGEPTEAVTTFIAPTVVSQTTFEISLTVTDNLEGSDTSIIRIVVMPDANLPALTSVDIAQLTDTVVVIKDGSDNLHASLALLLSPNDAQVYIRTEYKESTSGEVNNLITQAELVWTVVDNTLVLESSAFGTRTLVFASGTIDVDDPVIMLGGNIQSLTQDSSENNEEDVYASIGLSANITNLYTRKSLITQSLEGYRFTILQHGSNTLIDFVTATHAFVYEAGSEDILTASWSYTASEQGEFLSLTLDENAPTTGVYDIFNTFDTLGELTSSLLIVDMSILPEVDMRLSDLLFDDEQLTQCIDTAALANNWLSVNEVTQLDCSSRNIASAQGIEQLTELEELNLSGNLLLNVNMSQLSKLHTLNLSNNQLNSIDFSNNPLLVTAQLNNNSFSNATVAYLSSISWINDLHFDGTVVLPSGFDFVFLLTVESMSDFTIFTHDDFTYDYTVDWGDGEISSNQTGDVTHSYTQAGSYEVTVTGEYPAFSFCDDNSGCSSFKVDLLKWGTNQWLSMEGAFQGLAKFTILADDVPDLSLVSNLSFMFYKASNFNSDISAWDISSVTNMNFMFGFASSFNGDISRWDTGEVTNMGGLFYSATTFNGDISRWDTTKVTKMHSLFAAASSFNGDLSLWDTSAVTQMATMFLGASNFNTNLSQWDVSQVTNMEKMFYNATNMAGDLSEWAVDAQVRHNNFSHEDSLLVSPIWLN